jgi:hypothetical protein
MAGQMPKQAAMRNPSPVKSAPRFPLSVISRRATLV